MSLTLLLALLLSYLIGSIPFTQLVAFLVKRVDLRVVGSRNVGGRNLCRQLGIFWGVMGGALDIAKGAAAMWFAELIGVPLPIRLLNGMAVVAGHNWPLWLRFQGGKGLLAALGAITWVVFPEGFWCLVVGLLILVTTHNVFYASIAGFSTMIIIALAQERPIEIILFICATWAVILLASLPDMIATMTTSGGIAAYFREPDAIYRQKATKYKKD